jgi:hypothetical protein
MESSAEPFFEEITLAHNFFIIAFQKVIHLLN